MPAPCATSNLDRVCRPGEKPKAKSMEWPVRIARQATPLLSLNTEIMVHLAVLSGTRISYGLLVDGTGRCLSRLALVCTSFDNRFIHSVVCKAARVQGPDSPAIPSRPSHPASQLSARSDRWSLLARMVRQGGRSFPSIQQIPVPGHSERPGLRMLRCMRP